MEASTAYIHYRSIAINYNGRMYNLPASYDWICWSLLLSETKLETNCSQKFIKTAAAAAGVAD